MGVHDVGVTGGAAGREREGPDEERKRGDQPRPPADVLDDAVPERDPEVAEVGRRHDDHVGPGGAKVLDLVPDEYAGYVCRPARIRGSEDADAHPDGYTAAGSGTGVGRRGRRTRTGAASTAGPNTSGTASARARKTKK